MKTLDVQEFHNGLDQTLTELKKQEKDITKVKQAVKGITSLDDALKGAGGEAIRSFYEECHTTFLLFYESFISDYKGILEKTKKALSSLEPTENGYISEKFLKDELESGVNKAKKTTMNMTDETNEIIKKVNHIINLPDLDDSGVIENAQKTTTEIDQTLEKLHTFDREQTDALKTARQDLDMMKQYIDQLKKMYTTPKVEIDKYKSGSMLNPENANDPNQLPFSLEAQIQKAQGTPMERMLKRLSEKNKDGNINNVINSDSSKGVFSEAEQSSDFEMKKEITGGFGAHGAGNASLSFSNKDYEAKAQFNGSILDTNSAFKDKGEGEKPISFQMGSVGLEGSVPYHPKGLATSLITNKLIGFKGEANGLKAEFDHKKSPVSVGVDVGHAEAGASIENYSASVGASASVADAEVVVSPFNWGGYKPLEDWFGCEWEPYIGTSASIGGVGAEAKVGLENEIKAAFGVGIGFKFGIEREEEE
ncbi:hypothetical protein HOO54_04380 [Bacillus sp. WMMC1349]|uniref:ribonuclease YeeF family protein n=1 Tax=Bacillus sp. WMMC1349 TaxID=2736254 RepID=UPI00155716C5|nr:LXG domain-containing protein [Bacillus sp. WMMC1349]NPC91499.1 hypothetical protein [Bacillus sp. WMMC1349]